MTLPNIVVPDEKALTPEDIAWQNYLAKQRALAPARAPRPAGIRFHGDTGKYSLSYFDAKANETAFIEDIHPSGVIIAVRWICRWKYEEDARYEMITREFESFRNEPITLLKIDRKAPRDQEFQETRFADYQAFKVAMAMPVPMTDKVKYPFDLQASIYVYAPQIENPQGAKVFRYRFGGTTRSAFFDYLKGGVAEYVTTFGVSDPQKMGGDDDDAKDKQTGEAKTFYTGTFERSEIPPEMRKGVMDAHQELEQWLHEGPAKRGTATEAARPAIAATAAPQLPAPAAKEEEETPPPPEYYPAGSAIDVEFESARESKAVPAAGIPAGSPKETAAKLQPGMSAAALVQKYAAKMKEAKTLEELDAVHGEIVLDKDLGASKAATAAVIGMEEKRLLELTGQAPAPKEDKLDAEAIAKEMGGEVKTA